MAVGKRKSGRVAHARSPTPANGPLESFKAFIAAVPVSVMFMDRDHRFVAASATWLANVGMTLDQIVGRRPQDLWPGHSIHQIDLHERCMAGEKVSTEPQLVERPDGARHWIALDGAPWRDHDGEVGGVLIILRDVTAEMLAEEEARRSRSFLTTVLENTPQALMVKDDQGRFLMMNRATETLFGIDREALIGQRVSDLQDGPVGHRVADEDRLAFESDEPVTFEESIVLTRNRGERSLRKTKVVIRNPDGPDYLLVVSEDVTERRRQQEELERTRAFLSTVIDNIPAGLTVKDAADGRLLISNRAAARVFGLDAQERTGLTHKEVFPPELAARFSAQDAEVISTGEPRLFEEQPIPSPSGLRYLNQRKVLVRNADGSDYLLSISEDVTERRKAADELQHTRAFLETVINAMPAGITVKDAGTGALLMMNPAVEEIYGVSRGENIGKDGREVFSEAQAQRFAEQDLEVVRSGVTTTFEDEPVETRSGQRFLRRKKVLIRNDEGPDYLLSISEDVTDRKLAQDALKDALVRAETANVAKSEFLANMSHEIRTPLNGVLGLADALARMQLTPRQQEIVAMIVSSGKALTAILSDVLDLAKAEASQLELREEPFSLRETIGAAAFLFETVARDKGLEFRVGFDGDGPDRLVGDPLRIKQIVSNLISNAVKFTDQGEVAIFARSACREDGSAMLEVAVKDTGPGFTETARAKLFGRFEQGDGSITRQYGGTGLGLSIARTLAQMMGGDIDCTARPGEGATFVFQARLGIDRAASHGMDREPVEDHAALGARRLRVLLAEDHVVNQRVVQLMLDGAAELVIAANGQEAVDACQGDAPFDVVLMDTQMPVMDGLTAIRLIRAAEARAGRGRVPIISLTANAMAHQVQAALEAGADQHLAKPITSDGLYAAINQALEAATASAGAEAVA